MKNINIVIARYQEDIEWSKKYNNVVIYNKGDSLGIKNEIMLKNVGREGHTYAKYIIDNYDNLPDYVFLLQGRPHDHFEVIENYIDYILNIDELPDYYALSSWRILTDFFHLNEPYYIQYRGMDKAFEFIFDKKIKNYFYNFVFGAGAQFFVSKNSILRNSIDVYKRIVDLFEGNVEKDMEFLLYPFKHADGVGRDGTLLPNNGKYVDIKDPIFGHHMERLWPFVFNTDIDLNDV